MLDTDLPEELRQELVRGDIPNFVRRLASLRDTVSTPKLRAKFATDNRFRTHVQAYLSQFEELLTQAAKVDQGRGAQRHAGQLRYRQDLYLPVSGDQHRIRRRAADGVMNSPLPHGRGRVVKRSG